MEKKLIVFLDSGDTIIDEGTEIHDDNEVVVHSELIPGADVMVRTLHERGYTLALVADGLAQSFKNMFTQHELIDYFQAHIYSEDIGVGKPDEKMFRAAMEELGLNSDDYYRVVMVGNNLSRDIKGANRLGITSIFLNWTPRYSHVPADESEKPDYIISKPLELVELVEKLNDELIKG